MSKKFEGSSPSLHQVQMATVWFHRYHASDMLVFCESVADAYALCVEYVKKHCPTATCEPYVESIEGMNFYGVANTRSVQVSYYSGHDMPPLIYRGITSWNADGTVLVSKKDALLLGKKCEPPGFITGESEGLWKKETRTAAQLDRELDAYMTAAN
jgi:hypothetical protein